MSKSTSVGTSNSVNPTALAILAALQVPSESI